MLTVNEIFDRLDAPEIARQMMPQMRKLSELMPQMVAIFNGLGGAAAALIAVTEFLDDDDVGRGVASSQAPAAVLPS